jgi:hypothetical protein
VAQFPDNSLSFLGPSSLKLAVGEGAVKSRYEQLIAYAYVPFMESVTTSGFESSDPSAKLRPGSPVFGKTRSLATGSLERSK